MTPSAAQRRTGRTGRRASGRWAAVVVGAIAAAAIAAVAAPLPATAAPAGSTTAPAATRATTVPPRRPSPVQDVQVAAGTAPGTLVVTWSAPAYNGAYLNAQRVVTPFAITDYDILGVPAKTWAACDDLSFQCTVTGLRPGVTYAIRMVVWNALGRRSVPTAPVSVVAPA